MRNITLNMLNCICTIVETKAKIKTNTETNVTHLKGRNGAKNEGEGGDDDKSNGDDGDNLTQI